MFCLDQNVQTYDKFWADRVLVRVLAGALNLNEGGSKSGQEFLLKIVRHVAYTLTVDYMPNS